MTRLPSSRTSSYQAFAAFNEELPQNEPSLLHNKIRAAHRAPETELIPALLSSVQVSEKAAGEAYQLAHQLVLDVRRLRTKASGVDALMHEFSLSSEEGVALMCLAEALLRIPDSATAKALIADKISKGQWRKHLGESPSLFVNATTWGLLITGKLLNTQSEQTLSSALTRLIAKGGEPLIRKGVDLAMRLLGNQFVIGQTIENALQNSKNNEARGYRYSYDMLGEAALTEHDAKKYYDAYCDAIHAIGQKNKGRGIKDGAGISIKLSALHPRYQRAQRARVMIELWQRLKELALLCKQYQIGLNIDAEETERLELSLDLLEKLVFEPELKGFDGLGFVVQAYQKRAPFVLDYIIDLARRSGHRLMIRLVKGAYWDSEVKRAQVEGMSDYPVYTRKVYTDVSYLVCAQKLLAANEWIYPQFATHNALTLATVYSWAKERNITDYEFQCLYGMGETLYDQIVGQDKLNIPCRIYAPVGSHETLLAYLVRRLLENGANSSFVNQIVDANISIESLLTDPLKMAADLRGISHPNIAKPRSLYGRQRLNSQGIDFADETVLQSMREPLQELGQRQWQAFPLLAKKFEQKNHQSRAILNPACHADVVGQVIEADSDDVEQAILAAQAHHFSWQQTALTERAQILQKAADLFEQHELELIALAIREAGKSFANAVAEIREAVDFLRYYAQQILLPNWSGESFNETLPGQSLGIVVCISPWNFPLAIFIGQLSAALAAGNVVLAKPAEQTPLIAMRAVELLYQAGLHPAALQFLPGQGETVGAGLVDDARIGGVVFTGSTEVAKIIYASLAERPEEVPLIAETGGQNVMIVDSSALPEQVVQDVITSAFDSAGQRCSALRVLCIQEDVADTMLTMLKGALNELRVGNPDR